jgi:hypothetical protein
MARLLTEHLREIYEGDGTLMDLGEDKEGVPRGDRLAPESLGRHPAVPPDSDAVTIDNGVLRPATRREIRQRENARRAVADKAFNEVPPKPPGDKTPDVAPRVQSDGTLATTGTRLSDRLDALPQFSKSTVDIARQAEDLIVAGQGGVMRVWYQAIGTSRDKTWAADVRGRLGNVAVAQVDLAPYDFAVSKAGNVLVRGVSATAIRRKAAQWQARGLLRELWADDTAAFFADLDTYLKNHAAGRPGADRRREAERSQRVLCRARGAAHGGQSIPRRADEPGPRGRDPVVAAGPHGQSRGRARQGIAAGLRKAGGEFFAETEGS